jgi:hypothetical protein
MPSNESGAPTALYVHRNRPASRKRRLVRPPLSSFVNRFSHANQITVSEGMTAITVRTCSRLGKSRTLAAFASTLHLEIWRPFPAMPYAAGPARQGLRYASAVLGRPPAQIDAAFLGGERSACRRSWRAYP